MLTACCVACDGDEVVVARVEAEGKVKSRQRRTASWKGLDCDRCHVVLLS